uniref:Odorant receptor n=1 Tax=Epiphyas postvittana TaxID=65032 RepID=A0A0K8TUR3_EPIPO
MDAMDLRYMKRVRFTLRSVGAWPDHVFSGCPTTKLSVVKRFGYTTFLLVTCCLSIVSQFAYLMKNMAVFSFVDLGQSVVPFMLSLVYAERTTLPMRRTYRSVIEEFVLKFHLIHHKNKSEYSFKMYNRVNKICEIATLIQHIQLFTASFMYNIVPFYQNYSSDMLSFERPVNGTFKHSVNYLLPFEQNNGFVYTLVCMFNYFVSYNLGVLLCCHDLQICLIVFHIWGHLKIIEHNLNHFQRPSIAVNAKTVPLRYSNEESKDVALCLKNIIQHYIMTKDFVSKTSRAYSISMCVYHGLHLITDCVLLLECSTMDPNTLATYVLLTLVMFQQLIQLSVVFELISSKGDSLADAVYGLPWECMDNSSRRTVLILLQIVQQPLSLKACGMVPVGVQTMLAVLKASFSYFLMLKTFSNKNEHRTM